MRPDRPEKGSPLADRRRPRVLLVEGDDETTSTVESALSGAGYVVHAVPDGTDIARVARGFLPDVALLETRLPRGPDGFAIATALRSTLGDLPIVFVTVAGKVSDRIAGFEAGADAYLAKPFAVEELLARLKALLRRTRRLSSRVVAVGDLLVNEPARQVVRHGAAIELAPREYELLSVFVHHPGQVFTRAQLLARVSGRAGVPNVVEARVSGLRRKLEAHGPRLIHTMYGRGYVFVAGPTGHHRSEEPVG